NGYTWGDLVLYVSNPSSKRGLERYRGMFDVRGRVQTILTYWTSSRNSLTGRQAVHSWVMDYIKTSIAREASKATHDGVLQSRKKVVNESFVLDFSLTQIYHRLAELCPVMTELLKAFTMTTRQKKTLTRDSAERNDLRVGSALMGLLGERSQRNSYGRHVVGLYLYASGAQRQSISILSHMGVCSSYTTLAGVSRRSKPVRKEVAVAEELSLEERAGILRRLSEACRSSARREARLHELGHVYDNINWIIHAAEQTMGHKDSMENGTCATVFPLFGASRSNMRTADFLAAFDNAPPLSLDNILLSADDTRTLTDMLEHTVLRIIVTHGGPEFARFQPDVDRTLPRTAERIPMHKTDVYPLRAMNIEEASIKGNAEVLETIFGELGHDLNSESFTETVKVIFGDQLSVARLRAVIHNRAGHDSMGRSLLYTAFAPGFFHYQMAATYGFLETHWGNPSLGHHDPASLYWHNTILDRKPFVISNRPPYRVARDLIFHSLYGRVLHCLELVTSCSNLDEYATGTTFDDLQKHIREIISQFANASVVSKLRSARSRELLRTRTLNADEHTPVLTQGDMVFENACLFLRDALVLREFADAIKAGDSGRMVIILKVFALSYRGSGRTKYAQEVLHVLHNLAYLWPKPLCAIIMNNWLVNTSGKANHWYPVDLLQEHNIFWTKTIYNAQGSGASWDWLEMVSPCINVLRQLVTSMNNALGSKQGAKHAEPDLRRDLEELRRTLAAANVYRVQPGRIIDGEKAATPNVVTEGLSRLTGPLAEYNAMFARLKKRRRRTSPLVGAGSTDTMESVSSGRSASDPASHPTGQLPVVGAEYDEVGVEVDSDDEGDVDEAEELEGWLQPEQLFTLDDESDIDFDFD
ncbi:uncharacterized protein C8Q71DRAFT_698962, partial [Rhodofomes roseus]